MARFTALIKKMFLTLIASGMICAPAAYAQSGEFIVVHFDAQGGTVGILSTNLEYGTSYGIMPVPALGGVRFEGWWSSLAEGGVQVNSNSVVNLPDAHTLFAKWNINDILGTTQVTWQATESYYWVATTNVIKTRPFSLRSSSISDSQSSWLEATFIGPCTFKFWWNVSSEDGCDFLSFTVDQVEQGSISGYNIANPGQGIGWTQQQLSLPTGEHVVRWTYYKDDSVSMGSDCGWLANMEYTPIVTVAFDAQGGVASTNQKVVLGFSPYGTLPTATKQGYTLAKWETSEGQQVLSNTVVTIITNHTLFARWTTNQYLLTFSGQGATPSPASKAVVYDSPYGSLAIISRTGYAFSGWFTQTNGIGQQILSETSVTIASNHSVYAKWMPSTYSVTFNPQGGTVDPLSATVTYGSPYGTLPTPARAGYSFGGWFTQVSGGGTQITNQTVCSITADQPLYAKWTARTFTLTFDGQGSTPSQTTKVVTYDAPYGTMAAVSKTGYSFVGWFTLPSGGGVQITNATIVATEANHAVFAAWNPNTYTVVFDGQGGSVNPTNMLVTYGMPYGELPNPLLEDAVMDSWWTQPNGKGQKITATTNVAITSTQTLYAKWDINSVVGTTGLVWTTDGSTGIFWTPQAGIKPAGSSLAMQSGSITNTQNTWILTTVPGPGVLTFSWAISAEVNKDIVTFKTNGAVCKTLTSKTANWTNETIMLGKGSCILGWSFTNDVAGVVNSNATWLADVSYIPIVTVTFDALGGVASTNEKAILLLGEPPYGELPSATKTGYAFNGWRTGAGQSIETNTVITILTNHTLYAQWTTNQYLVTFDGQGEIPSPDSKTVSYDSPYGMMPSISKTGYICNWFTATNGQGQQVTATSIVKITSNQTLYTKWTAQSFTLTFNGQGGTPSPSTKTITYDAPYGSLATVSKTGYTFEGWFTDVNGGGQQVTSGSIVQTLSNQTLYAKWTPLSFTLTFEAQDFTPDPPSKIIIYDTSYGTLPTAIKPGYVCNWFTATNGQGQQVTVTNIVNVISNQTLYAKWIPMSFTVTFNGQGGTPVPASKIVTYDGSYNTLATVSKTGYTFEGWFTDVNGGGQQVTSGSIVQTLSNQTLYAKWTPLSFTVTFEAQDFTPDPQSKMVTYDATYGTLPTTTKTGHVLYWFTEPNGQGQPVTSETIVKITSSQTLYAKWIVPGVLSIVVNRDDFTYFEGDTTAKYKVVLSAEALQDTMVTVVAQYVTDGSSAKNCLGLSITNITVAAGRSNSAFYGMTIKDGTLNTATGILLVPTITNAAAQAQYPTAYPGFVAILNNPPNVDTLPSSQPIAPSTSPVSPYDSIIINTPFTFRYKATDIVADVTGAPPITVEFQFEDGSSLFSTGATGTVTKTFNAIGVQTVFMVATDKDGGVGTVPFPINVVAHPSITVLVPPGSVSSFENYAAPLSFEVYLSRLPGSVGITNPVVVYLDVTPPNDALNGAITVPAFVSFNPSQTNKTVYFQVRDGTALSSSLGFTVTPRIATNAVGDNIYLERNAGEIRVQNVAPVIQLPVNESTNTIATVGQPCTFNWNVIDVPADNLNMQLLWDWGDGTTNSTIGGSGLATHTYLTTNPTFSVSVTAKDKDGDSTNIIFSVTVLGNRFSGWLDNKGLVGVPAELFAEDRNSDGIPNGFEYAFGTNLPLTELLLNIRIVNGRMVVDIPKQDETTTPFVNVELKASTNLTDWALQTVPAQDTTGKPSNRDWKETTGTLDKAFFKLHAELKE